jgi:hypothetical protein
MEGIRHEISSHDIRVHRLFGQFPRFRCQSNRRPADAQRRNPPLHCSRTTRATSVGTQTRRMNPGHQKPRMKTLQSTIGKWNRAILNAQGPPTTEREANNRESSAWYGANLRMPTILELESAAAFQAGRVNKLAIAASALERTREVRSSDSNRQFPILVAENQEESK